MVVRANHNLASSLLALLVLSHSAAQGETYIEELPEKEIISENHKSTA
jgi:hypothetical protein